MKKDSIFTALETREMQIPGLLFFASHRPLAFLVAQILYLVEPIAGLIGWQECAKWATILGEPEKKAVEKKAVEKKATKIG